MISIISNTLKVKNVTMFCIVIVLCMVSMNTCQCHPDKRHTESSHPTKKPERTLSPETKLQLQPCFDDPTTMDLCQRCAKESKSDVVFPLCCSNVDMVKDWCAEYIYFGQ